MSIRTSSRNTLSWALMAGSVLAASASYAQTSTVGSSQTVTWTCTGSNCPWGSSLSGRALVWPTSSGATNQRLGYSVSGGIYLPSGSANGLRVKVTSGTGEFYGGEPGASSHRPLASISTGETWQITGLATGEVVSVQSAYDFAYEILPPPSSPPPGSPPPNGVSQTVTWNCTGSNCPWGSSFTGTALVWPAAMTPTASRLGYTVSSGIYLPASVANTITLTITGGSASLYAGFPNDSSHRGLISLSVGESYEVSGLAAGEILSVQSSNGFQYEIEVSTGGGGPPDPPPPSDNQSHVVTWTCTGDPCPWGGSLSGQALIWPAAANPTNARLGYTVSGGIYLSSVLANGTDITLTSGSASLYAGIPGASSHRPLGSIAAGGGAFTVTGVAPGEVLSVQSSAPFAYSLELGEPGEGEDPGEGGGGEPGEDGVIDSTLAYWRCDVPSCTSADWVAAVINWPSWAAYSNNNRQGEQSRTVYNAAGQKLYPYMGSWADGCQVTAESGTVIIIEWQRGTNEWRETWLTAGQSHTINLVGPENGAMIETTDFSPGFSVRLNNCTPQPLP
jgi:hypothetical protein